MLNHKNMWKQDRWQGNWRRVTCTVACLWITANLAFFIDKCALIAFCRRHRDHNSTQLRVRPVAIRQLFYELLACDRSGS